MKHLNNVIKHSYKENQSEKIELKVSLEDKKFLIIISDEGHSRTNFDKPTLEFDPDDIDSLPEGGMGLFIIDTLMDSTDYKVLDGKNMFTMVKKLNSDKDKEK